MEKVENILKNKFDDALDEIFEFNDIPGISAGICQHGKILTGVRGWKNYTTKEKLCKHDTFCCCSVSKIFTSIGIMKLIEEGKINLNEKIIDMIPDLSIYDRRYNKNVDIGDLLSHRISFYGGFLYTDESYELLGKVIELISGEDYWEFIKKMIFDDCDIDGTDIMIKNIAVPHFKMKDKSISICHDYFSTRRSVMSCGIVISAEGLLKVGKNILESSSGKEKGILSKETCRNMWKEQGNIKGTSEKMGMGWFVNEYHGMNVFGHDGKDEGFSASFWLCPENETAVCVLSNMCGVATRQAASKIMQLVL